MSFVDKLFGKKATMDPSRVRSMMAPTQGLVTEQIGIGRDLMDPMSAMNLNFRNMMAQRAAESGAQSGLQMQKMAAMTGVSPAVAMMQSRMAMNQNMGNINNQFLNQLNQRFGQGMGLLQSATGLQQSLDEGNVNTYLADINAQNARRNQRMGMAASLVGSAMKAFMPIPGAGGTP